VGALTVLAAPLCSDDISQINAQGKTVVIQRAAIVVRNDPAFLIYKHFDLKDQRVEKVSLAKGSLPYTVQTSPPDVRHEIIETWKRFGYKATVTDQSGRSTRVWDAYIDFYPPQGRGSLLESVPVMTSFTLLLAGGGADEFNFSQIGRVEFRGETLRLALASGQEVEGRFLMPTQQPAEAHFMGITEKYDPASPEVFDFSLPLGRIKEIRFER
jgi:hypothetical protein